MRVRISNSSINSFGFRVLTSGLDIEQYKKNPVLLYMHERGNVIGLIKDIRVEGDEITGEPVFDEATDLSKRCKAQFEFGSLKMVSIGADIKEVSAKAEDVLEGQTRPTVTKSKLSEVSLVDIGSNDDSIALMKDGKRIELEAGADCGLPLINNNVNSNEMELSQLALSLGLAATATEAEVNAKLASLKEQAENAVELKKQAEALQLAAITQSVENAVNEKRIAESKKGQFVELGKSVGIEMLNKTLEAIQPTVKLSAIVGHQGGSATGETEGDKKWKTLHDVPEGELLKLKKEDPKQYCALYKAEYGINLVLNNDSEM